VNCPDCGIIMEQRKIMIALPPDYSKMGVKEKYDGCPKCGLEIMQDGSIKRHPIITRHEDGNRGNGSYWQD
jgi:ribosomal protein S27AE